MRMKNMVTKPGYCAVVHLNSSLHKLFPANLLSSVYYFKAESKRKKNCKKKSLKNFYRKYDSYNFTLFCLYQKYILPEPQLLIFKKCKVTHNTTRGRHLHVIE